MMGGGRRSQLMWLLLLLVAASQWSSRVHAKTVMGDVSALQVFKLSVSNATALADWQGFEPCKQEWFGVNCGESTRSKHRWAIVAIELPNCDLGGEIPEAIGDLVELTKLDLRNNNFTGLLPVSLSRLTALESLDVSGNSFEVAPSTNLTAGAPPPLTSDPISIIPEPDAPGPEIPGVALYVGIAAGVVVAILFGVALVLLYIYLRRRRAEENKDFAPIKDVATGADGRDGDYGAAGAAAAAGYAAGKKGGGGKGVFGRIWKGTGKAQQLLISNKLTPPPLRPPRFPLTAVPRISFPLPSSPLVSPPHHYRHSNCLQQQANAPAAPPAAFPAHDRGANLLPPPFLPSCLPTPSLQAQRLLFSNKLTPPPLRPPRTATAFQQQAHSPVAPPAAFPAHNRGANLLPPHDPSAMIPHSGASNHSGWGAAISAVGSGVNSAAHSAAHSGVHGVNVEHVEGGGAVSPYAPASAYASAAEPGSNMSSQFPSRTPSQTPSQPPSHVAGPGLAAAIAAGTGIGLDGGAGGAGGGIGGAEGGSGRGGGGAAHSSNSSVQTPGVSVGSLESGRNMGEYRMMLPGRSLSNTVMELTFEDVLGATDNLAEANVIGSGGFGRVYCGRLAGASVAVKVLEAGSSQGDREFQSEVELLSRLRSPHLVHLVGYCIAGGNRVLVYNLMANGSLSDLLHNNSSDGSFLQRFGRERPHVEWQQRMQIALGAARGLMFLHHAANPAVIHRDFKSSNVLVDHDFHARIADFGLARDGPSGEKRWVSTRVLGTTGYLSPEYVTTGRLTPKSDVYSFGIVLLELLTGLVPIDHDRPPNRVSLTSWALPLLTQRDRLGELLDPALDGTVPLHEFMQAASVAAVCLQADPDYRPHMDDVVQSLMPLCKAAISPYASPAQSNHSSLR
ncbi:unnamed protein product [Closterium sp. Yama58-4]|nr:unnamed protein product [Closterium sp. Yama58-4]